MSFCIFLLWTFILVGRPQDFIPVLAPLRLALVFTIITLVATFVGNKKIALEQIFKLKQGRRYLAFFVIMILGIPFAYHRREAFNYIFLTYLVNVFFFYILIIQIDSLNRLKHLILVTFISVFLYSMFVLFRGSFFSGRLYFGTIYDPNDIAYFLISLFPLGLIVAAEGKTLLNSTLPVLGMGISICVILLTGSRAGIIGLAVVVVLIFVTKIIGMRRSTKIVFLIGFIIIFLIYGNKIDVDRYLTLKEIGNDYNVTDEFGRMGLWKRAFELISSNPLSGVGVACFPKAIGEMREKQKVLPMWQDIHNSFLQVAVEVGLIGFIVFVSIIIECFKTFSIYRKLSMTSTTMRDHRNIGTILQIGFIGSLITSFFLSQGYSLLFTLYFAFSATLRKLNWSNINDE